MPRQPRPADDVDLKQMMPIGVGDVLERLGFIDAEIVDEDIDGRHRLDQLRRARRRRRVGQHRPHPGGVADPRRRCRQLVGTASADDHLRAFRRQPLRDGKADARGGTGDQRRLVLKMQFHG